MSARAEEDGPRKPGPYPPGQKLENPVEASEGVLRMGRQVYVRYCVTCHGLDGKGKTDLAAELETPPLDLSDKEWKYGKSDGEIFTLIRDGVGTVMESYATRIPERRMWELVHFIRTLRPKDDGEAAELEVEVPENPVAYSVESVGRGKQYYARFCVKCHGMNGKGDTEMLEFLATPPSDLTNGEWKYGGRDGDIFNIIMSGTATDMEAFKGRLSDEQVWHIVNFLRSLGPEDDIPGGESGG